MNIPAFLEHKAVLSRWNILNPYKNKLFTYSVYLVCFCLQILVNIYQTKRLYISEDNFLSKEELLDVQYNFKRKVAEDFLWSPVKSTNFLWRFKPRLSWIPILNVSGYLSSRPGHLSYCKTVMANHEREGQVIFVAERLAYYNNYCRMEPDSIYLTVQFLALSLQWQRSHAVLLKQCPIFGNLSLKKFETNIRLKLQ